MVTKMPSNQRRTACLPLGLMFEQAFAQVLKLTSLSGGGEAQREWQTTSKQPVYVLPTNKVMIR